TGPRLPGDKGPHRPPERGAKSLTHNPFAALAQKLEESGKVPPAPAAEAAAPEPAAPEHAPEPVDAAAPTPPVETPAAPEPTPEGEPKTGEGT
ncbi:MAG TPA: phosphohydrolase, partial [Anaeromyxobacteraceae bacterium]|nr:phosphohydrolase [Anaeromyxobacteraceae bacterium]